MNTPTPNRPDESSPFSGEGKKQELPQDTLSRPAKWRRLPLPLDGSPLVLAENEDRELFVNVLLTIVLLQSLIIGLMVWHPQWFYALSHCGS